jgi:hypothetical protein
LEAYFQIWALPRSRLAGEPARGLAFTLIMGAVLVTSSGVEARVFNSLPPIVGLAGALMFLGAG